MNESEISTLKMPVPEQLIAGRYRIVSRLGSGGMGLVFLAEPLAGGANVALKFLDPESADEARMERFLREAKVAVAVQHPGVAQVHDLGRDEEGRLFIAFELVEGEDLREVLRREGRLTFHEAREVALQVASVLAHAHERDILHRDVKPENLRVRREGDRVHVKVLDFGIARLLRNAGVRLTGEGMLAGTPRYMAPEQVKDEPLDGRTDVYALGLVFFEMLTGAIAMGGKNVPQILLHQVQTPVPTLKWVDGALDFPQVDAFIATACAKAPHQRFESMHAFARALEQLEVGSWPAPSAPREELAAHGAPTRELAPPASGLSDTLVKPPAVTELEPALTPSGDVPTLPEQPPRPRILSLTESKVVQPLEAPTIPERPMVRRPPVVVKETVMGMPAPAPRRWTLLLLGAGLGLTSLAGVAWWWLHRGA